MRRVTKMVSSKSPKKKKNRLSKRSFIFFLFIDVKEAPIYHTFAFHAFPYSQMVYIWSKFTKKSFFCWIVSVHLIDKYVGSYYFILIKQKKLHNLFYFSLKIWKKYCQKILLGRMLEKRKFRSQWLGTITFNSDKYEQLSPSLLANEKYGLEPSALKYHQRCQRYAF